MILAVMDAGINHVHPCVFFVTFQTAQRPGLLKYNSRGTGDKYECESSISSNQVPLKNWTAAGFHSHLLDKESTSAWWSESQTKVREDFFICCIFLSTEMEQTASLSLPSQQGGELSPAAGGPEQMLESWASLHRSHIWPTFEPSQTETLTSAKYSQLLRYAANPKIRLEKKKRKQKKMKKKIMLIVQKVKGCFSVPQRRCGPVLRNARCKFRFLCYYS